MCGRGEKEVKTLAELSASETPEFQEPASLIKQI